jgi:Mlc titration factor MtfA (ptsG expression regulator)
MSKDIEPVLEKYHTYYRNLSTDNKHLFRRRVMIASASLDFTPNNFPQVTKEMMVLITSALVQITFGLRNFKINRFRKIIVVPFNYNFMHFHNLMGHVDFKELCIVLSWPSVQEGYVIPDDAMNVALHEIAHALQEENRFRMLYNKFFEDRKMAAWNSIAVKKLQLIRAGEHNFLKTYGGINMLEMFSVCIETFFEQGAEFKKQLPDLYDAVADLLNQDPLKGDDPVL